MCSTWNISAYLLANSCSNRPHLAALDLKTPARRPKYLNLRVSRLQGRYDQLKRL